VTNAGGGADSETVYSRDGDGDNVIDSELAL
jgi:hypothetical protein